MATTTVFLVSGSGVDELFSEFKWGQINIKLMLI
jgi:hypothetical protein